MDGASRDQIVAAVNRNSARLQSLSATGVSISAGNTLGVPLHTWYKAQDGRPIELCPEGKPVKQLV